MASLRVRVALSFALGVALVACGSPRPFAENWQTGKHRRTGELLSGKQTGKWTYWYASGSRQASGQFLNDKQDGAWTWWYESGQTQSYGRYAGGGQRVGEWGYWYENGKRQSQGAYGTAIDGTLKPGEGRADRQHGLWRYWRADGALAAQGWYDNGSRALVWSVFAADGTLAEQGAYWQGMKVGPWRERTGDALTWVDHGCPAGYECYREPSDGAPRRWGMLKDQRPAGLWLVFGDDGGVRYAELSVDAQSSWMAWRADGSLRGAGRRGTDVQPSYFTPSGAVMVESAPGATPVPGREDRAGAAAAVAADEAAARAPLVAKVVPAPVAQPIPAAKPVVLADISLAPAAILPGWWTPKEEGVAADLIRSYATAAGKAQSSYDWDPAPSQGRGRKDLLGKPLPLTRLLSSDGEVIDLTDLHGKQKVVLVILRGFSGQVCLYCSTQTAALVDALPKFAKAQTKVVLLYPGSSESVPAFIQAVQSLGREMPQDLAVAIDPDLNLVRSLDIEDTLSKPTTIILDRQGTIGWSYVGANKADRPAVDTLLNEVSRLP